MPLDRHKLVRYLGDPGVTIVLSLAVGFAVLLSWPSLRATRLPGNNQGFEPTQPIAFSHRLHAGEMGVSCLYCHSSAEKSRHAGIPATSTCMNCHKYVQAPLGAVRAEDAAAKLENRAPRRVVSAEIRKLYQALALNDELKPDPSLQPRAVEWVRVHSVPDFVYFDHRAHVTSGVACQSCHGPVETMERVRQTSSLSMGTCVNCHREVNRAGLDGKGNLTTPPLPLARGDQPVTRQVKTSTDCAVCHY
jgi:hypothetical protein